MAAVARSAKTVKKLEKPRPLKIASQKRYSTVDGKISSVEDIMTLAESVCSQLTNGNCDHLLQLNVVNLCANLKQYGQTLEGVYKDQLNRCFVAFRNGCKDEKVDYVSRIHLLEIIELRARNWVSSDDLNNYYRPKLSAVEEVLPVPDATGLSLSPTALAHAVITPTTPQPSLLNPGEVIKASGKFAEPTKIPGKNYCKDEVVIRNSDSGKVNPGAKERLVQITGPNEEKINYPKHLIEDTIRCNASPVRLEHEKERVGDSSSSLNSSASDESNRLFTLGGGRSKLLHSFSTSDATLEYKYTVTVDDHTMKIAGANLDLVLTAKLILDEFFYGEQERPQVSKEWDEGSETEASGPHGDIVDATPVGSSRVDGIDSGATSESEETYKAPASSAAMKLDSSTNAFVSVKADTSAQMNVLRHRIMETCAKETELPSRLADVGLKSGTTFSSTTNKPFSRDSTSDDIIIIDLTEDGDDTDIASPASLVTNNSSVIRSQKEPSYLYTREQLLRFSLSKCVKNLPDDWERICRGYPAIVTKQVKEYKISFSHAVAAC
ncbi:eukaryotic translation initiation factor 4E-binding protein Mextli-like [Schistocerca americana]|uniref:eukaryotic translation initiation factor 4E-binding protein Mextli-like n=1 Tax=Schistocerca americana TaxID=7009 RepID=UPI001F502272|nr:eukaryotic translation initiation factor 4E-binding protein Mextli-like [Schistocerca americana]